MNSSESPSNNGRSQSGDILPVTVVVCAYTEQRWSQTRAAIKSAIRQIPRPAQVVLVVDYNPALMARAKAEFKEITVIENSYSKGLSGARNTGLAIAKYPITAFLDDDAEARTGWLDSLISPYASDSVVAIGGRVDPIWPEHRPSWFPQTFDWVVGCSYIGLPNEGGPIRNPIGANMSMRTSLALAAGGFTSDVGRVGTQPRGCEETELAIRLAASWPGADIHYVPSAAVDHHVSQDRVTLRYFARRCWHEGRSKSDVVRLAGASAGLAAERRHAASIIPIQMVKDIRASCTGDIAGIARAALAMIGFSLTVAGYAVGRMVLTSRPRY